MITHVTDMPKKIYLAALICLLPTACTHGITAINVKPAREPMYNMTQSSRVLGCVGAYIQVKDNIPIDVYVSDIPDHTTPSIESSFLTKNAVMMVTTAVDRLGTNKVQIVGRGGALPNRRQVQILGAFTEMNRTIGSDAASGKTRIPMGIRFDMGINQSFNHIAVDLAMSENNRIIPKSATSTSIEVETKSGNTTLTYDEGGDYAAVAALGFTAQEGFHSAERLLIETSVAIMMARYFNFDIANCLEKSKNMNAPAPFSSLDEPIFPNRKNEGAVFAPKKNTPLRNITIIEENTAETPPPIHLESEPHSLPMEGSMTIIPRPGAKRRIFLEQPEEYIEKKSGHFSGQSTTEKRHSFIDQKQSGTTGFSP